MLLSFNQSESFKVSSVKTENVLSQTVSRDCKHINDIHDILSCLINRRNTIQVIFRYHSSLRSTSWWWSLRVLHYPKSYAGWKLFLATNHVWISLFMQWLCSASPKIACRIKALETPAATLIPSFFFNDWLEVLFHCLSCYVRPQPITANTLIFEPIRSENQNQSWLVLLSFPYISSTVIGLKKPRLTCSTNKPVATWWHRFPALGAS